MRLLTRHRQVPDRSTETPAGRYPVIIAGILAMIVAWAIYRPDRFRPFDILDFGEFIPLIKDSNDVGEQLTSVIRYNVDQSGRANLVQVFVAVLKWRLFGYWTPGWQMTQALVMFVVMGQTFLLARRLGASRVGAGIAASIFLVAPGAARGWVRLTMGEPVGMIVVLALALRAVRYQRLESWGREVVLFSLGAVFVVLTKELMAPALLLPLFLALCLREGGDVAWPQWNRRNIGLLAGVGLASAVTLVPLAVMYLQASSTALSSLYGSSMQSPAGLAAIWFATLVPFNPIPAELSALWAAAFAGYLLMLAIGSRIALRAEPHRMRWILAALVVFPLIGALSYAPWPAYEERYGFPYLAGTALLAALAATHLQSVSRSGAWLTGVAWLAASLFAGSDAAKHAARTDAVQRAADEVINAVVSLPPTDSVLVTTRNVPRLRWTGLGPTLQRLSVATNRPWPPTRDVRCEEASTAIATSDGPIVVAFASHCPGLRGGSRQVLTRYRYVNWSDWAVAQDVIAVEVFSPAGVPKQLLPAP